MISYIKNIIDNIKFAWKCWKLYKKIKKSIQNIPNIDEETAFKAWIDENILYLTEFATYTNTEIDDIVIEEVNILVQNNWKSFYSMLLKTSRGEKPSIIELTRMISSLNESSKIGNGTIIGVLLLTTNISSIIQRRRNGS